MAKSVNLQFVRAKALLARYAYTRTTLHLDYERIGRDRDYMLRWIAELHLIVQELDDHLHNLSTIRQHIEHGIAGTVPESYDPWYFDEEVGYDRILDYDPYREMGLAFTTEFGLSLAELSPMLRMYIDTIPEADRQTITEEAEFYGPLLTLIDPNNPEAGWRPLTPAEADREADAALIHGVQATLFAEAWETEMQQLQRLIDARALFAELLALID